MKRGERRGETKEKGEAHGGSVEGPRTDVQHDGAAGEKTTVQERAFCRAGGDQAVEGAVKQEANRSDDGGAQDLGQGEQIYPVQERGRRSEVQGALLHHECGD